MTYKKWLWLFLILCASALWTASVIPVQAHAPGQPFATNYCSGTNNDPDRCLTLFDGAGAFLAEWGLTLAVSVISIIAMVVWFTDRAALALFELVTGGTWLMDMKTHFLDGIASFLPDMLRDTAFGPGGLMYIALVLAGILMTIPVVTRGMNRLAKPERVMTWGVLLSVLFVSGTVGYDLIDRVETLRQDVMQTTIGTDADYGVTKLVLVPMHAQESEAELQLNNLSDLPNEFVSAFFPDVQKIDVSVKVIESGLLGVVESEIESPESKAARIAGAVQGLFYSLLGFFAGVIVLLSGISFVVLGVAALFLILFLFAAMPLGFFEFGEIVLRTIVERYVQVVIYSLGVAIFVRVAGGMVDQLPTLTDIGTLLEWLLLMLVFYLALRSILKSSFGLLSMSFMTFSHSINAIWSGGGVTAGPGLWERTKQAAGGAISGALMMGGAQGALLGAAGTALGLPFMMRGGQAGGHTADSALLQDGTRRPANYGDVFQNNGAQMLPDDSTYQPQSTATERTGQSASDIFGAPPPLDAVGNPHPAIQPTAAEQATKIAQHAKQTAAPAYGASPNVEAAVSTARTLSGK